MPVIKLKQTTAPTEEPVSLSYFEAHMRLDVRNYEPAPDAPSVALAAPAAPGNCTAGVHRVLATFVTADGETQAGEASAAVTVADAAVNGQIAVTNIPTGGDAVTARKLYMTAAGGDTYYYAATVANNTATTATINLADASLGAGAPNSNTTADPNLRTKLVGAREEAELLCRRAFVTQSFKLVRDEFPRPAMNVSSANWYGPQWGVMPGPLSVARPDGSTGYEIKIPRPPLQRIDFIKYYDQDGVQQTLDPSQYVVDDVSEPAVVTPAPNTTWPTTQNRKNAVEINFTAGYGAAAAVPATIKDWICIQAATKYERRTAVDAQPGRVETYAFVDHMLDNFRVEDFDL